MPAQRPDHHRHRKWWRQLEQFQTVWPMANQGRLVRRNGHRLDEHAGAQPGYPARLHRVHRRPSDAAPPGGCRMTPALVVPLFLTGLVLTAFSIVHATLAIHRRRARAARTTAWQNEHRIVRDAYLIVLAEQ